MPTTNWTKVTQHLVFTDVSNQHPDLKTSTVAVTAKNGVHLGTVKWFANWRRYTFQPFEHTIFDYACLTTIAEFISEMMNARKGKDAAKD